jgi:hypothetical protein
VPPTESDRLTFDDLTKTVTLDGKEFPVMDLKAYEIYKTICRDGSRSPIIKAGIRLKVQGVRGKKTIPALIARLPEKLRKTINTSTRGYGLVLPPLRKKGAS